MRKRLFLMLGYTYRLLYRLPVIGDPVVRGICGAIAFMNYRSPYGIKSFVSMDDFRERFEKLAAMADLDVGITGQDEEKLELLVPRCPYGFSRPAHRGVCDAAMDMDRKMYGYCGARLIIDECIPDGFPACRVSIHKPEQVSPEKTSDIARSRKRGSKMTESQNRYDVIIIGAGVGGLVCGNYLVRKGKKVLILEHGKKVGGNISGIRRKGFFFDAGSQSTENVGILFTILEELGLYDPDGWDQADWRWMTPDCDVVLRNFGQIRADFKKYFPESSPDIDEWFDFIEPGCNLMKDLMGKNPFPFIKRGAEKYRLNMKLAKIGMPMLKLMPRTVRMSGGELGREIFSDPRLAFLFGEFGNENMLLFMYYSFWYSFLYDYTYPKGGLVALADMLADSFREKGGEIKLPCTVDRVLTSGDTAIGVEAADGEKYYAEKIVNTGNPKRLVTEMCDPSLFPRKFSSRIKNGPVSVSVVTAFLGLDMDDEELAEKHKVHHTIYWRTYAANTDIYDPELHRKSWAMTSWVSMHDKSLAPEGKNSIIVQIPVPYDWMNGWGTGSADPMARNDAYRALKEKVLDDIIEDMEYMLPGIRDKVEYKELATPRTLSRYTLNPEGSIMGWSYDMYRTPLFGRFVQFKTPVKNLYLAGHYSIWPGGIVFSALTGKFVAAGMYEGFAKVLLW